MLNIKIPAVLPRWQPASTKHGVSIMLAYVVAEPAPAKAVGRYVFDPRAQRVVKCVKFINHLRGWLENVYELPADYQPGALSSGVSL